MSSTCRSCKAPIAWLKTRAGKNIPVDAASVDDGGTIYDSERHVSHFTTCPNASSHSKKSIASKAAHVQSAGQTRDHKCHWPDCDQNVPPAMWGCKRHWFALPLEIRNGIWRTYGPGQEIDLRPSNSYMTATQRAYQWIAEQQQQGKLI